MVRTLEDPKCAVSKLGDPAQTDADVRSHNKISVNDYAIAHHLTWSKLTHSDSKPDRSAPLTELDPQGSQEASAHLHLARLIRHHFKPKDPQTMSASKPMYTKEGFAPSSSQRRAPTAQMVPLPSNAAVTPSPATAIPGTSTARHIGLDSSSTTMENPQVFFPATVLSSSLPTPSILPSTPPALSKQPAPKKSISKQQTPKILLTPAPATAPNAFKDTALAALVQNTKFLSPVKQRTNGVKKQQRPQILSSSPTPKLASTPESVPEEKRGRGRPRARLEEHPLQEDRKYWPPLLSSTPIPRTVPSTQSNSSVSTPSSDARLQQHVVTPNIDDDRTPTFCSEEPHLWPGRGDHVALLLYIDSKPAIVHSEPIQSCANHAAHQDSRDPHGHGTYISGLVLSVWH